MNRTRTALAYGIAENHSVGLAITVPVGAEPVLAVFEVGLAAIALRVFQDDWRGVSLDGCIHSVNKVTATLWKVVASIDTIKHVPKTKQRPVL